MRRRAVLYTFGVAIGLAAGLFAAWVCRPGTPCGLLGRALYTAELMTYDYRLAWSPANPRSPDIAIVTIDEETLARPELAIWPWPRRFHARVVRHLARAGAAWIGIDVLLCGTSSDVECPSGQDPFFWSPPLSADDEELATALADAGNVVLAVEAAVEPIAGEEETGEMAVASFPLAEFETAAAALGAVNLPFDFDGTARRYLTSVTHQDAHWPTMAMRLVALSTDVDPQALARDVLQAAASDHPALPAEDFLIHYRAPVGCGFTRIPYHRVLSGDFEPALVRGKIVLVGASARSLQDLHRTPVSMRGLPGTRATARMPGVEIIASATDTMLNKAWVTPAPVWHVTLIAALMSMAMGALVIWLRPLKALALAWLPLVALALLTSFEAMWARWVWLPLVPLLVGISGTFVLDTIYLELTAQREERRLRQAWSMRVSPEVLRVILSTPSVTGVAGRRVEGTVFFSDLEDFTSFCSQCPPEQVVSEINQYLDVVTAAILKHGGTVHKFIGDGVMAVFGDPVRQDDHATRAVRASLEVQERMAELRATARLRAWPMNVRIGLHSGELVAGDIGSKKMLEYTVMGQTVSLASRIEGANKELGTPILMSHATAKLVGNSCALTSLGQIEIRGVPEPVEVFSVTGCSTEPAPSGPMGDQ